MAQPNVVREPSMEEILASIRRIIENNEPVENVQLSTFSSAPHTEPETVELTIDENIASMAAASSIPPVERAESLTARRVPERVQEKADIQPGRPMSLADVAARVKAASDRRAPANDSEQWHQVVPTPTLSNEEREPAETYLVPANMATPASAPQMPYERTEEPVRSSGENMMEADIETQDVEEDIRTEIEPTQIGQTEIEASAYRDEHDRFQPHSSGLHEAGNVDEVGPGEHLTARIAQEASASVNAQLLSATTEEKVSRSFEELVQALGGSERSLEELAEEMLKPMLQEWLDDNLPTLVERLVREEIERVARGPRR